MLLFMKNVVYPSVPDCYGINMVSHCRTFSIRNAVFESESLCCTGEGKRHRWIALPARSGVGLREEGAMRPFYQGKLDVFCAVYAMLNAFQQLHSMSAWQAKRVLGELLSRLPDEMPDSWNDLVWNRTDYVWLVEWLVAEYGKELFPIRAHRPWADKGNVAPAVVWSGMSGWMGGGGRRTAVFRFQRFLPAREDPVVCHWTTVDRFMGDTLFLFDASMEETAVHLIDKYGFVCRRENVSASQLLVVDPACVFLLETA